MELKPQPEMQLRTFTYRKYASAWIVILFFVWVFGVMAQVTIMWFPFESPMETRTMFILLLASFGFGIYCSYLVIVNMTAVLLLDEQKITYRDRYVKVSLRWEDVCEMTTRWIRGKDGRAIYFKLGLRSIDGWEELQRLVIERASLKEVIKRKLPIIGEMIVHARRSEQ
ncbi:MAG: hypothetical protein RMK18_07350 [Armatimonadota bacterium]|nr:hypothetical protein [Armatimonadota bacterium]MCX7778311.1 hypothetical protein [Armatimonadota bacterium]MDW8025663.1 hypothetical protein [Armatimonadota bacterium]